MLRCLCLLAAILATCTTTSLARGARVFPGRLALWRLTMSRGAVSGGTHLLLGSGSASRKAILAEAGYSFEVFKADIDERAIGDRSSGEGARELVLLLGNAKADAIIRANPQLEEGVLLTADQVVVCKNQVLEKPLTEAEAREYMGWYGDHPCSTVGSIVLTDLKSGKRVSGVETATITFRPLSEDVISQLIKGGEVFYCAGGLMIEHPLVQPFIVSVEGSMQSVMGMSTVLLQELLDQLHK